MKGGWSQLDNEKPHNLYSLQNIIRMDEMVRACSKHRERRDAYRVYAA
jgi:stalled ribosome rescue protein Dom34